ncbi:MAG: TlyA family RNA methyltransferase, partial [Campylobacter sp.]|nr:TlyA family RNA methyltransferase [Campylobacter sp.]
MRFDKFVANALNISRNQASELIKNEKILLDGQVCKDSAKNVETGEICVVSEIYVSRGALKLKGFLRELKDEFSLDIGGLNALDI